MAKYSEEMVQYLLQRLDPLDVLEFIDYHPETIQRSTEDIKSWCPLCQNSNGRYLKISLKTKQFESTPPDGPDQRGNLVELYMRTKRLSFDDAVHTLADEFSVPLIEGDFSEQINAIAHEAEAKLEEAADPAKKDDALRLAADGFGRVLQFQPKSLRAWRGMFLVHQMRQSQGELAEAAVHLMDLMGETEDFDGQREVAEAYLREFPRDAPIRERLAQLLLQHGSTGEAARELVTLADQAKEAKQFDKALSYYREIQRQKLDQLDVLPMIITLLVEQQKPSEARAEIQREVLRLQEQNRPLCAAGAAARKLEIDPEDDVTRLQIVELCVAGGLDKGLALALEMTGDMMKGSRFEPATEGLGILTSEQPDNTLILEMLITAQRGLGEHEVADELEYRLAELYQQQGKSDAALAMLERIIRDKPQNVQALAALGELLIAQDKKAGAIDYLRRVVEIQIGEKEYKKALETVIWILGLDSSLTNLRATEAKLLFLTGAKEESTKIVQLLTKQLQKAGDKKRLAQMLDDVVAWNPADSESRLLLSSLYDQMGDVERSDDVRHKLILDLVDQGAAKVAEDTIRGLLKKDPKSTKLRGELADIYLGQEAKVHEAKDLFATLEKEFAAAGNYAEQKKVLEKLRRLDPMNADYLERLKDAQTALGDTHGSMKSRLALLRLSREKGETDDSEEIAREILESDPEQTEALENLVELQLAKNQMKDARKSAAQYSSILFQKGSYKETEQFLAGVLKHFSADIELLERSVGALRKLDSPDALMARVDQLIALNSYSSEKKIRLIRDILHDDPQFTEAQRRLTRLLRAAGRIDELLEEIKQSISAHQAAGSMVEVVDLYEQLLEANPEDIEARETLLKLLKNTGQETRFVPHMLGLAAAYTHARRADEAIDAYNLILDMEQENEVAYRGIIKALRMNGGDNDAVRRLRELAALYLRKNKVADAVNVYREITEVQPANQEARREIISLKRELGQINDAADELGRLAEILRDEGDAEGAIAARREAVILQPDSMGIHKALVAELKIASRGEDAQEEALRLSLKLSKSRQFDHALAILDEMIVEDEENAAIRRARAHFFDERGDERRALQEYRELEKLGQRAGTAVIQRDSREMRIHPELEEEIGLELLPEYDFDSFVVGARNKFAHATAKAVAEHPGSARNPLFLYSGVGLGKTHLMHAIANQMMKNNSRCRIVYTSTEYFTTALEHARDKNLLSEFRGRHRATDILLLDDIQFLAGREESQEEFFHIFNMLHQARKQIVVTSDRPPKDIARLDMRLRTRFGQGVIVDIQSPDLETRLVILRAEAQRRAFAVPEDALAVIANKITTNVRELKGAFNLFLEHHEIGGEALDSKTAKDIVDKYYTT